MLEQMLLISSVNLVLYQS